MGFFQSEKPPGPVYGRIFPVQPGWLAQAPAEEAIEPERAIVDAHHHLWDMPGNRYLIDEFRADLESGHRVVSTVFADCGAMYRQNGPDAFKPVGETEFVAGVAAMSASGGYGPTRIAEGIVGFAELNRGASIGDVLDAHIAAAGGRFRGIRQSAAWHPDPRIGSPTAPPPHMLTTKAFQNGARELARRGLSFDAWVFHSQLDDVLDLARSLPQLPIIVVHTGGPLGYGPYQGKQDEVFGAWSRSMRVLAGEPNVTLKIGGFAMRLAAFEYLGDRPPPGSAEIARHWRPWVECAIEQFGAERCMFESNFPVEKMGVSYLTLWNAFKLIITGASEGEKDALLAGTARRVYRLS